MEISCHGSNARQPYDALKIDLRSHARLSQASCVDLHDSECRKCRCANFIGSGTFCSIVAAASNKV